MAENRFLGQGQRTAGDCRVLSGDDGGEPGGRPNRNRRGGFDAGVSPTSRTTSATDSSTVARALPNLKTRSLPPSVFDPVGPS